MKVAIIPARGGSKRIPRKNIKDFCGRPMIAYAIDAARNAGIFDAIVVSTDDDEIAAAAVAAGAEVPFRRPADLADDFTPTVPVIAHAVAAFGTITSACCIYPGVPLLDPSDIVRAEPLAGTGYAFPVAAFPSAIQRALRRAPDGTVAPFDPTHVGTRTQDLEPAYHDAGQFYWGSAEAWLAGLPIHPNGRTIVIPEWRVVDIDTPDDWERGERLYRAFA